MGTSDNQGSSGLELGPPWHPETQELESMNIQWSVKDKSSRSGTVAQWKECCPGMYQVLGSVPSTTPFHREIQDIFGCSS